MPRYSQTARAVGAASTSKCQIVHDLSTFLTPQFHNEDTINFHTSSLFDDVHSNDLTFCVSEATREDVLRYLGPLDPEKVVAVPLAATTAVEDIPQLAGRDAEPYVLVLGTIEPRKNIGIVLGYLACNRSILRRTKFVFLGRYGWGEKFDALLARYELRPEYDEGASSFPALSARAPRTCCCAMRACSSTLRCSRASGCRCSRRSRSACRR